MTLIRSSWGVKGDPRVERWSHRIKGGRTVHCKSSCVDVEAIVSKAVWRGCWIGVGGESIGSWRHGLKADEVRSKLVQVLWFGKKGTIWTHGKSKRTGKRRVNWRLQRLVHMIARNGTLLPASFCSETVFISTRREKIDKHPFSYLIQFAFPFLVLFPNPQNPPALPQAFVSHHDRKSCFPHEALGLSLAVNHQFVHAIVPHDPSWYLGCSCNPLSSRQSFIHDLPKEMVKLVHKSWEIT
jgi:hypothetical protein